MSKQAPVLRLCITACALFSLFFLTAAFAQSGTSSRDLFCTLQSRGGIYTLDLRVPREGSGPCQVIAMSPTSISDPSHHSTGYIVSPDPDSRHATLPRPLDFASTHIGTLTTLNGETYTSCSLLTRQKDGLIIIHAQGLSKIVYTDLSPADRKKFSPQ